MKNKTTLILLLSILFSAFTYSQGTLEVEGNGNVINNPDTTPSLTDDTDYGDVGIANAQVHTFVLDNTASGGNPSKRLNGITVAISGSSDFVPSATSLGNLKGNETPLNLGITFTPSSIGIKSATVTITYTNGTNSPYTFDIQGNGIVSPADINITGNGNNIIDGTAGTSTANNTDFSLVNNGNFLVRTFTIENTGGSDLTNISSVSLTNDSEFEVTSQPATATLTAGNSTTFQITFSPTSSGIYTDTVTLTSDDADESPYTFAISGEGVIPALINEGAVWYYYDASNEPSDQGANTWKDVNFDNNSWSFGPAELGYNEGDEATVINTATEVAYFRNTINIPDASIYNDLVMEAIRDDGMVVYINGTEVWRDNMDPGTVNYSTFANTVVSGSSESTWITKTIGSILVDGDNTIAVEVHQENAGSSDISFNFIMNGFEAIPAAVIRGPYLQTGTSTSVIIKWKSNTSTESIINYGTSLASLSSNQTDNAKVIDHEVTLTGLTPNTKYFYNIANTEGVYEAKSNGMYIKTAPVVGTKQLVRAWILGDAGTANQDQRDVRDAYYNYVSTAPNPDQTDMMLFLGDNAYNSGTDSEYQTALFDIYGDMLKKSVSWSCLGNHDGYSADSNSQTGPYYDIFTFPTAGESGGLASGTEAYYAFDYANIHFIVLDSYDSDRSVGSTMYNWAQSDVQNTTQDWIVVLFHHPPYTKGSHNSDTETQLIEMRENFMPMLESNGVDLILSGHSHCYERSYFLNGHQGTSGTFNPASHTVGVNGNLSGKADTSDGAYTKTDTDTEGAVYITTGSAGKQTGGSLNHNAMYHSVSQLGSCILEVEDDGSGNQNLTVKFLRETGAVGDYFTINKNGFTLSTETNTFNNNEIKVYPVPANDLLNIKTSSNETFKMVMFYNTIGEMVKQSNKSTINVSNMATGMYLIEIKTDKKSHFKSIIIE